MSWISKLLGTGTKGIGDLAKDIREAIKGKELDPNKQLETAERLGCLYKQKSMRYRSRT